MMAVGCFALVQAPHAATLFSTKKACLDNRTYASIGDIRFGNAFDQEMKLGGSKEGFRAPRPFIGRLLASAGFACNQMRKSNISIVILRNSISAPSRSLSAPRTNIVRRIGKLSTLYYIYIPVTPVTTPMNIDDFTLL
jgi:hypothetical protein